MADPVRRPATLVLPPLPYALALYAAWRLQAAGHGLPLPGASAYAAIYSGLGAALISAGLALFAWTLWVFWRHRTTVNPYRAASALVTRGPFAWSRNPIYVGDWLIYAGVMLWLGTAWPVLFAPLVWAIIRYGVIRHEEAHLAALFGDDYTAYRARVRRWL